MPEGLKTLSLRDSTAGALLLPFLPTSLTSLDLSYTLVVRIGSLLESVKADRTYGRATSSALQAEYSSLYEMEKINFFFKDIARCAPKLRYIDLRCGYPYGTRKYGPVRVLPPHASSRSRFTRALPRSAKCLRGIVDTVVLDLPLPDDAEDTIPDLAPGSSLPFWPAREVTHPTDGNGRAEERWRPREEHPEWEPYLERCAKSWETVKTVPPEPVPDGDDEDEKEDDGTGEDSLGIMLSA